MLVHFNVTPSINLTDAHLYTWVERGILRVKCLAQEHNTVNVPGQGSNPDSMKIIILTKRPGPVMPGRDSHIQKD